MTFSDPVQFRLKIKDGKGPLRLISLQLSMKLDGAHLQRYDGYAGCGHISALTTGESAVDTPVFRVLWETIQCHADIQERFYPSILISLTSGGLIRAFAKSEANIPMERSMIIMNLINSGAFKIGSQQQENLTLHRQCCWHQGAIFRYSTVMIQLHN